MKCKIFKSITIAFMLIALQNVCAQNIVYMNYENGVYTLPCKVNGCILNCVFDTGAHTICMSGNIAIRLLTEGYIDLDDFVDVGTAVVADGREVSTMTLRLRDVQVGSQHIRNIDAVVMMDSEDDVMLLGLNAIQKLGTVQLDGNKLTITPIGMGKTYYASSTTSKAREHGYHGGTNRFDRPEGYGTYYYSSGDRYTGYWKNGKYEGRGTYNYSNGDQYVGSWKNGMMDGFGTYTWANGNKYVGSYKEDKKNGYGTFYYKDGRKIYGYWRDGEYEGK